MSKSRKRKIFALGAHLSTVVSVSLVLLIVGMVMMVAAVSRNLNDELHRDVAIVVDMVYGATDTQVDSLRSVLDNAPYVSSYTFASADDVLRQELQYEARMIELVGENPYSAEFDVRLHPQYVNADSIGLISARLCAMGCVDNVYSATEVVDSVNRFVHRASIVLLVLGGVLLVIAVALIINTIHISIYSRRFVIHTMKLVGATSHFIRMPFVWAGVRMGAMAALIASAALCGLRLYISTTTLDSLMPFGWLEMAMLVGALFVIGTVLCGTAAMCVSNRFIGYSKDSLYK